jgi:SAM-dependent methyltransferase
MISDNSSASIRDHYDAAYFKFSSALGGLAGSLNAQNFSPFIKPTDAILDFGSGGGSLLLALDAREKLGLDINPHARQATRDLGIETVESLDDAPNDHFDVVISNHALEHAEAPFEIVRSFWTKLKPAGLAVVVVPCERYDTAYHPDNIDQHLYTWSPVNLGNLFHHAEFDVIDVRRIVHSWPPRIEVIDRVLGRKICNRICWAYALARPKLAQVRIVARRPL